MNRGWHFHRNLLGIALCGSFLILTGCQAGKLSMPKLTMPKLKAPNMAFWKKDNRIASQPNDQLTPPSHGMNPESSSGEQSFANNDRPGSRMPQRRPYDDAIDIEDGGMASNPAKVRGVTPNMGEYNGLRNNNAFGSNDPGAGSTVSNPHFGGGNTEISSNGNSQFGGSTGSNTPTFDNGYVDNSQPQGGNSRFLKNEYVKSKTADSNQSAFTLPATPDSTPQNQYPNTGYENYSNTPNTNSSPPPAVANKDLPQFALPESTVENPHYQDKLIRQNEMKNIQHVGGNEPGESPSQIRTADLPDALKGGSGGYMPGSTKPGTPATGTSMPPNLKLPAENSNELPMQSHPNQMMPPTSSPTNSGQFGGGQFGG